MRRFLDDPQTARRATDTDKGHGRIEPARRADDDIAGCKRATWPASAIGKSPPAANNGKTTIETRCYLLSQAFPPERFNAIVRSHWGIEKATWSRRIMDEDQARNARTTPPKLALLRKLPQSPKLNPQSSRKLKQQDKPPQPPRTKRTPSAALDTAIVAKAVACFYKIAGGRR